MAGDRVTGPRIIDGDEYCRNDDSELAQYSAYSIEDDQKVRSYGAGAF